MWIICQWKYRIMFLGFRTKAAQSRPQFPQSTQILVFFYLTCQFWCRSNSHYWKLHKVMSCSNFLLKIFNVCVCKTKNSSLFIHKLYHIFKESHCIYIKICTRYFRQEKKKSGPYIFLINCFKLTYLVLQVLLWSELIAPESMERKIKEYSTHNKLSFNTAELSFSVSKAAESHVAGIN